MRLGSLLFCILLNFCLTAKALAQDKKQEILTNKSIIALKKAGIDKKLILLKIQKSQCDFDLSTDGIIALKSNKVEDDIIEAMINYQPKQSEQEEKKLVTPESKKSEVVNTSYTTTSSANTPVLTSSMSYNGKTAKVTFINSQIFDANNRNIIGMRINRGLYLNYIVDLQVNTTTTLRVVMRKLKFSGTKLEPQKFFFAKVAGYNTDDLFVKDDVDDDWMNYFYITYIKSGVESRPNFPRKLGKSFFEITSVDKDERTISGKISIAAETSDGTHLNITGSFNNISYDGGSVTAPLYQR